MKKAWKRAVMHFNFNNPRLSVDKTAFAKVFKHAYLEAVKPGMLVNAFRGAGIYPPDRCAVNEKKLLPSKVHRQTSVRQTSPYWVSTSLVSTRGGTRARNLEEVQG